MSPRTSAFYRSLAALPLAATAMSASAHAQPLDLTAAGFQAIGDRATAWTFDHENILGTSMQLVLRTTGSIDAHRAEAVVLATIDRYSALLSAWDPASEFSRWAATQNVAMRVSPELLHVLALFDHWRAQTGGAMDASAEAAVQLWRNALDEPRIPTAAEIASTVAAMQQPHWHLDPAAGTATRLSSTPLVLASFTKSYIAGHVADAALANGASGVMLNIGGDIVVRGNLAQPIAIANPFADAENDAPIDRILLRDRAIATSGNYRRGAHILDPRTAHPASHIASATVIAEDPATAGALATAFSVLSVEESRAVAARTPGVDYLLVARNGDQIASDDWQSYRAPALRNASYSPGQASGSAWNGYELAITLELARSDNPRYRRPYVAVWVEDESRQPVRTISLWYERDRWLPELRAWYHDDQIVRSRGGLTMGSTTSATRPPGKYTLKWDGKDDQGKLVKPGKYTICIEAAREHGDHQLVHQEIDLNAGPRAISVPPGAELGAITFDYRKQ